MTQFVEVTKTLVFGFAVYTLGVIPLIQGSEYDVINKDPVMNQPV